MDFTTEGGKKLNLRVFSSPSDRDRIHSYKYRLHSEYAATSDRTWCHGDAGDYCPLVIISMSLVIIVSFVLILYLCSKQTLKCKCLRAFTKFLRKKLAKPSVEPSAPNQRRPIYQETHSAETRPSNLAILHSLEAPVTISRTSTITSRLLNRLNSFGSFVSRSSAGSSRPSTSQDSSHIFFVDVSKHMRPPPSYEESQHIQRVTVQTLVQPLNRASQIRASFPRKYYTPVNQTPSFNSAFSMENLNESGREPTSQTVFPTYRCLALTTNSATAEPSLFILAGNSQPAPRALNLAAQPLVENTIEMVRLMDEVPPPYEAVVSAPNPKSQLNRTRSLFNSALSLANTNRLYQTMVNSSRSRREFAT